MVLPGIVRSACGRACVAHQKKKTNYVRIPGGGGRSRLLGNSWALYISEFLAEKTKTRRAGGQAKLLKPGTIIKRTATTTSIKNIENNQTKKKEKWRRRQTTCGLSPCCWQPSFRWVCVCVVCDDAPNIRHQLVTTRVCCCVISCRVSFSFSLSLYAFRWTGIYSEGVSVAYHSIYWTVLLCQRAATWLESQVAAAEMFIDGENFQTRED